VESTYTRPATAWTVPDVIKSEKIQLKDYEVKGVVNSQGSSVVLTHCIAHDVIAGKRVKFVQTWAESVSAAWNAIIRDRSVVNGGVEADLGVTVEASKVGSVNARRQYATIIDGSVVNGAVEALGTVTVTGSAVKGLINARHFDAVVTDSEVAGAVMASDNVRVFGSRVGGSVNAREKSALISRSNIGGAVSASKRLTVEWSQVAGDVTAWNNNLFMAYSRCGAVVSHGVPTILKSTVGSLTIYLPNEDDVELKFADSTILGNLTLRASVPSAGADINARLGVSKVSDEVCPGDSYGASLRDDGCDVVVGANTLWCARRTFAVTGAPVDEIIKHIGTYCSNGAGGYLNGQPASYLKGDPSEGQKDRILLARPGYVPPESKAPQAEERVRKIKIIGGNILGNLEYDFPADIVTSDSQFKGQLVRLN
ncbi:MAG: hypothetical protein KDK78_08565, partial [Chlamydiia bacterium]|nr:hypothetical protein [Chlamydiia bacterium]